MARFALCVGINDYPGTDSDLAGCVNDARDWSAALEARRFQVRRLIDREATGRRLRDAIGTLLGRAREGDVVVFQFSGHGSYVPDADGDEADGRDECLCPYDVGRHGPITDDELFEIYSARVPGVRLIVVSDSCHSGSVARFAPVTTPPPVSGNVRLRRMVKFLPPATFLPRRVVARLGVTRALRRSSAPGRHAGLLLAGCQDAEYSYDAYFRGRANGAFTYVALRALRRLRAAATYGDWYRAIRASLPSRQYPQTPNLYGTAAMKRWRVFA
jgi:uncharacterized caspase-like protein